MISKIMLTTYFIKPKLFAQHIVAVTLLMPMLFSVGSYANELAPDNVGNSLIASVVRNYKEMESYEDEGYVETKYADNSHDGLIEFHTYVSRPMNVRIEWAKYNPVLKPRVTTLVNNICGSYTISHKNKIEQYEDLRSALSANHGVSGAVTRTVPWLVLFGHKSGLSDKSYFANLLRYDQIDGAEMVVVRIRYDFGLEKDLWIDPNELVIRKIEKIRKRDGITINKTIFFKKVKYNHTIDSEIFDGGFINCAKEARSL